MLFAKMRDEAQNRKAFPDRCGVKPKKTPLWPGLRGDAFSLFYPLRGRSMRSELFGDTWINQRTCQRRQDRIKPHEQRRVPFGRHRQPPVWLMWRDIWPSIL